VDGGQSHPSDFIVQLEDLLMQEHVVFVGVDVAKATLSSAIHGSPGRHDLNNEEKSIVGWLATLPDNASVAVESTGKFHLSVVRLTHLSGRKAYVLNARDVFFFAKALGVRAKTDRTDARLIADYLAQRHAELKPWAPATPLQDRVQELLRCRAAVAAKRSSLNQALKEVQGLDGVVGALQEKFDALLGEIDSQVSAQMERDEELAGHRARLRTELAPVV
jgi:transposase